MRFQIKRNNKHQDHSQYGKHFQFSNRYEPAFFFTAVLRLLQSGAGKTEQIKYTDTGNKSQRHHQNHSLSNDFLFQLSPQGTSPGTDHSMFILVA